MSLLCNVSPHEEVNRLVETCGYATAALTILRRRCTDGWPSACTEANDLTANNVWLNIGDRALDLLLRATTSAW